MAYIGQSIKNGTFSVLDTSGNTYNGSNTTFNLGTQVGSPAQLLVSHDGVVQKPGTDYTLATGGTQITFTTAPASGASIFIVEISGAVGGPMNRDINGDELILDVDGDTSITADTDDQIDFKAGGTDTMHVVNGKVGITSVPDLGAGLHIKTSDTGGSVNANGDELVIEGNGNAGLSILTGNTNTGAIFFADADDANVGGILYDHSTDTATMTFRAGDNVRMALKNTNNDLTISQGNDYTNNGTGGGSGVSIKDIGGTRGEIGIEKTGTGAAGMIYFYNGNGGVGSISTSGSATAYNTSSDYRLKENVNYTFDATTRLKQLKPARFNFKADTDTTVDGFLAHEVSSIVPEAVTGEKDAVNEDGTIKPQAIDQGKLVPLLVKTIQELEARITALEG
jgi:hypothetical protein